MNVETTVKPDYEPSDDEEFMNDRQKDFFRRKLIEWKESILDQSRDTVQTMQEDTTNIPDLADRASVETDRALELRTRDRQRKLVGKIEQDICIFYFIVHGFPGLYQF